MSCRKNMYIPCTFAISHAHFEGIKVFGLSFLLWGFSEKYFQEDLVLCSSGYFFKLFHYMMRYVEQKNSGRQCE